MKISWEKCRQLVELMKPDDKFKKVFGVPRGGIPVAALFCSVHGLKLALPDEIDPSDTLVVDDIIDSAKTASEYMNRGFAFNALISKGKFESLAAETREGWIHFPWEDSEGGPEDAVVRLLQWVGEDVGREGLLDTPKRVVKAFKEMTSGLKQDPKDVLGTVFTNDSDQMVVVTGIRFSSMCEHHLLPFTGTATVGYVPDGKVIGLSKIPRLVEVFAKRPQIQEQMTKQISEALMENLKPLGVGAILRAHHSCMGCRGVKQPDAEMITSSLLGCMKDNASRQELLSFIHN